MSAKTRIYYVFDEDAKRGFLVDAASQPEALRAITHNRFNVVLPTAKEAIDLKGSGVQHLIASDVLKVKPASQFDVGPAD